VREDLSERDSQRVNCNQGSWMRKHDCLTTMIVLIVLGTIVTIKAMNLAITSAAAFQVATISDHTITAAALAKPKIIVPAAVVDHDHYFFVGSGDASAGSRVRP
jgi:hypothetical protein